MMFKTTKYKFLVQQYKNRVYSYSVYLLRNKMDADDVTQEVLIRIWENLEEFNITSATTWIMKTAHNLCIDYLRRRQRSFHRELEITDDLGEVTKDDMDSNNPMLTTHYNMIGSRINDAIEKLPENLRSVFVLYEIEEMKYNEISKILDMPLNSVKVYLLRARKKLQNDLKSFQIQESI